MMAIKIFSRFPQTRILLIELCCFLLLACSNTQDQLQTAVSEKGDREIPQHITEGVIGQIKNQHGQAVTGAMIIPTSRLIDAPPIPEIAIVTDEHGRYEWPLQPGAYQISVFVDDHQKYTQNVEIKADQVTTLDFILE